MRRLLVLALLLVPLVGPAQASLEEAMALYEEGRCQEAGEALGEAQALLWDYVLYWQARCLARQGRTEVALQALSPLLSARKVPPPLRKKAWLLRLELEGGLQPLREFLRQYPSEHSRALELALALRALGDWETSERLLLGVFVHADGALSLRALRELSRRPVPEAFLERAKVLRRRARPGDAELALQEALRGLKDEGLRRHALGLLAWALGGQGRHLEASAVWLALGRPEEAALSLLRAGSLEAFRGWLKELGSDRLRLALARRLRHAEPQEALRLLREISSPEYAQQALWLRAWLLYRQGRYQQALPHLQELYQRYGKSRYLYWLARAAEALGQEAGAYYQRLLRSRDIYGLFARLRLGMPGQEAWPVVVLQPSRHRGLERARLLASLGLREEAVGELQALAARAAEPSLLAEAALELQRLGAYSLALRVAERLPPRWRAKGLLYPRVHWQELREASLQWGLDPYLVLSMMRQESLFDPEAVSRAGARGLMQLMPATAREVSRRLRMPFSVALMHEPRQSIRMGAYYLGMQLRRFGSPVLALCAYNAGPRRVSQWLRRGPYRGVDEFIEDIPFRETRLYVERIILTYAAYRGLEHVGPWLAPWRM